MSKPYSTDDLFLVLKVRITIRMREQEAHLLLIETIGTPNTGNTATAEPRRVI